MIQRPLCHYDPIPGNSDCRAKEIHSEFYYDLPALAADPELRDSMWLVHRGVADPTTIQVSIDGRPGILRAMDIAATFGLSVVLANSADYRKWSHPSPW